MNYSSYLKEGLQIFILIFILGKFIDNLFKSIQKKYNISKSKIFGIIHLIVIISIAYFIHIFTSQRINMEFQIYHPSVLFSSLMLNIQKTMFYNFDL